MLRKIFLVLAIGLTTCFLHATTFKENLDLAIELKKNGNYTEALTLVERAAKENPNNVNVLFINGQILIKLDRIKDAIPIFERLHISLPENTIITQQLADLYQHDSQINKSAKLYVQLIKSGIRTSSNFFNLAWALQYLGFHNEAKMCYESVLHLNPEHTQTYSALGKIYLAENNFKKGWEYAFRHNIVKGALTPDDLKDKTLLLFSTLGVGDIIQFLRYAKLLKQMGCTVFVEGDTSIRALLSCCPYVDKVVEKEDSPYRVAITYLGYIFHNPENPIPSNIPYLYADPTLVSEWKNKIDNEKYKVGICWTGNQSNESLLPQFAKRSMNPIFYKPLTKIPNLQLYSLHTPAINKTLPDDLAITYFDDTFDVNNGAFMDTIALMMNLDLIITIDTSIAHLAGALGKPVWVLLPYVADWRWMLDREDSPWYPSMRLFRQQKPEDWHSVINAVYNELNTKIKKDKDNVA